MPQFTGFPAATFEFLDELERNNNRDWFGANKARYEAGVREPALDFITTMGPELAKISFSKDKTPYKTNIGIQFRHERGKDVHAPGYYLHIDNETCFLGVGLWRPDAEGLAGIRQRIVERPNDWKKARDARAFKSAFELGGGESLKRPPRGFSEDSPHMEDLKRKDFIAVVNFAAKDTESRDFVKQVASTFRKATPFMTFLCAAVGVEF
jgi:uncharacterized protein (TIGR02453 family)